MPVNLSFTTSVVPVASWPSAVRHLQATDTKGPSLVLSTCTASRAVRAPLPGWQVGYAVTVPLFFHAGATGSVITFGVSTSSSSISIPPLWSTPSDALSPETCSLPTDAAIEHWTQRLLTIFAAWSYGPCALLLLCPFSLLSTLSVPLKGHSFQRIGVNLSLPSFWSTFLVSLTNFFLGLDVRIHARTHFPLFAALSFLPCVRF